MKVTMSEAREIMKPKSVKVKEQIRAKGGLRFNCVRVGKPFTLRINGEDLVK